MGNYIQQHLLESETIRVEGRVHWGIVIQPVIALIVILLFRMMLGGFITRLETAESVKFYEIEIFNGNVLASVIKTFFTLMIWIVIFILIFRTIRIFTSELAVTSKRVMMKVGLISTWTMDTPLDKINNISIERSLFGQLLDYGVLHIHTSSGFVSFRYLTHPAMIQSYIHNNTEDAKETVLPEKIQPASVDEKTVPMP